MAKRARPANFKSLPYDSGVRLEPGQTFIAGEDCPLSELWNNTLSNFRNLRGAILRGSFDVENELVLLLLLHVHGPNAVLRPTERSSEHEQTLRGRTFGELIREAQPAILASFTDHRRPEIFRALASVKRVRDLMAHQPMWLTPVNAECGTIPGGPKLRTVGFDVEIADNDFIWTVDDDQAAAWLSDQRDLATRLALERLSREGIDSGPAGLDDPDHPILLYFDGPLNHEKGRIRCVRHGAMPDFERMPGPELQTNVSGVMTVRAWEATKIL